ncbi:hypothetical protein [Mesorhizobium sp. Z1-4]|uniref:hypothetical protein n=1 Tax=Mesorhizobium sp. Z1-4 TaxID=2448478 RepID=UPI000FDAC7E6|nr:hypothetical protein [Mesorhizobium sp. Z1-4]
MNAANPVPPDTSATEEAAGLQAALKAAAPFTDGCQTALETALAETDGFLLFQLRSEPEEDDRWVAAVMLGTGEKQSMNIVTMVIGDGSVTVETLDRSREPLARIVPAYADVLIHLRAAA